MVHADGLRLIPRNGMNICHHNSDSSRRGWLPRGIIFIGSCRTLLPRWILSAQRAISVHDIILPEKPRTQAFCSGAAFSTTGLPWFAIFKEKGITYSNFKKLFKPFYKIIKFHYRRYFNYYKLKAQK